jgi:hypothetical protein
MNDKLRERWLPIKMKQSNDFADCQRHQDRYTNLVGVR